jgi:hypothetical protein
MKTVAGSSKHILTGFKYAAFKRKNGLSIAGDLSSSSQTCQVPRFHPPWRAPSTGAEMVHLQTTPPRSTLPR